MRAALRLATLLVLLSVGEAHAQLWSSVLDASRGTDWTTPGVVISGVPGIPSASWANCVTANCNTLNGGTVTTTSINNAITSAPANTVVRIPAGSFGGLGNIVMKSDVALRGAGPDQTKLTFTSGADCGSGFLAAFSVCGSGNYNNGVENGPVNWTAGYAKGTSVITLASVSGIVANTTVLILDQIDDGSDPGDAEVFVNGWSTTFISGGPQDNGRGGVTSAHRGQQEFKLVTAVNGNDVTISPPLHASNWRSGQSPQVWWATTIRRNAGIESLSIDAPTQVGIAMFNAYNCWIKNVRLINPETTANGRALVRPNLVARITIRDSYFYGQRQDDGDPSQRYGIEAFEAGDLLIENNIFHHINSPFNPANQHGSVIAYNYIFRNQFTASQFVQFGGFEPHQSGHMLNLFEGNQGTSMTWDNVHGTHNLDTIFRNQFMGRISSTFTSSTVPLSATRYNRFLNVLGNVWGEASYHTKYQTSTADTASCNQSIYYRGGPDTCSSTLADSLTASSMYRFGNYDVATGTVRWCGNSSNTGWATTCASTSEVPTSLTKYSQAVPGAETLPASFYLAARPSAWWKVGSTTPPWPPVGPDVTGGNVTSGSGGESTLDGHAHKNPARLCFESMSDDTPAYTAGTVRTFPSNCYQDASVPVTTTLAMFLATILILIMLANLGAIHAKARR